MTPIVVATTVGVKKRRHDEIDPLWDKPGMSSIEDRLLILSAKKADNFDDKPSFRALARLVGLSETTIQKLASRESCHSDTLLALATTGVNLTWLLTGIGEDGLDSVSLETQTALFQLRMKGITARKKQRRAGSRNSGRHVVTKKTRD